VGSDEWVLVEVLVEVLEEVLEESTRRAPLRAAGGPSFMPSLTNF
jgi:hypothetical protein